MVSSSTSSPSIVEELCQGKITPDIEYGLETVNCLGACINGSLVIVHDEHHGEMTTMKVSTQLRHLEPAKMKDNK
jgi:NADH-quinone oxidoreductase subunit E